MTQEIPASIQFDLNGRELLAISIFKGLFLTLFIQSMFLFNELLDMPKNRLVWTFALIVHRESLLSCIGHVASESYAAVVGTLMLT